MPELVYLQTRKLLRDIHYKRASRRSVDNSIDESKGEGDFVEREYNPNLQSMRSDYVAHTDDESAQKQQS